MFKKISVFLAIFITGLFVYHGSYVSNAQNNETTIEKIVHTLNKQHVSLTEVSLYAREEVKAVTDQKTFYSQAKSIKSNFRGFKWEVKRERDLWKAIGTRKSEDVNEVILLTYAIDEHSNAYISYHVTGQGLKEKNMTHFQNVFQTNYEKNFLSEPIIFSCATGEINDKMESVLSVEIQDLLRAFNAKPVESLVEESFTSVSAYTGLWKEALQTKKQEMNLQIALRKTRMGGQTTIVVGTPIITSEY
jgi:hypothetical protein